VAAGREALVDSHTCDVAGQATWACEGFEWQGYSAAGPRWRRALPGPISGYIVPLMLPTASLIITWAADPEGPDTRQHHPPRTLEDECRAVNPGKPGSPAAVVIVPGDQTRLGNGQHELLNLPDVRSGQVDWRMGNGLAAVAGVTGAPSFAGRPACRGPSDAPIMKSGVPASVSRAREDL
jgi:hypothetical protein